MEASSDSEWTDGLFYAGEPSVSQETLSKSAEGTETVQFSERQSLNTTVPEVPRRTPVSRHSFEGQSKSGEGGGWGKQSAFGESHHDPSNQADFRAQFYEHYKKEAEEYDKEFMKKYDEDLNTTLIFAGLFSAVTSAFIIQVHSQLQQDPNEETAALLRVLIYTINSTTLGGVAPTVPQWSGPLRSIVHVQALLYASLATSLFSAFLAMLGKQWLNRYASIDMRGSAIERSQNRQRKLDGIVTWYFDYVMDSLPVILQVALLLLGCALSRYLWNIDVTIASVVLGVTAFGLIIFVFFVAAGTFSISCPYQTPFAQVLRFLWQKLPHRPGLTTTKNPPGQRSENQPGQEQTPDGEVTALDFRCISWMLQTSLDHCINELTLKFLGSILTRPGFNDRIVADCLDALIGCVSVTGNDRVVVTSGSEQLAEIAATCFLRTLSLRLVEQPASTTLRDVQQRYESVIPFTDKLRVLPFYHTLAATHSLITGDPLDHLDWNGVDPSTPEGHWLVHNFVKIAWYRKEFGLENTKEVPRWILRFTLSSLLRDPEPPLPVVADCLFIAAIDLGCTIPRSYTTKPDKSALLWRIVSEISSQSTRIHTYDRYSIPLHRELLATLFLWATRLEMVNDPQRFDEKPSDTLHQFVDSMDQIHSSDPQFAVAYVDVLLDHISLNDGRVAERPGSEWVARTASICVLRALSVVYPRITAYAGLFDRYMKVVPPRVVFEGRLCRATMNAIHKFVFGNQGLQHEMDYEPLRPEYALFAKALAQAVIPRDSRPTLKVPRWILRFVLRFLSKDPPPPTSVTTSCLSIIATDLGCDVSSTSCPVPKSTTLAMVSRSITQKLEEMVGDADPTIIRSKHKALTALFPYVVSQEAEQQHERMLSLFLRAARVSEQSGLMCLHVEPVVSALLDGNAPDSSKRAAILASPHVPWWRFKNGGRLIRLLAEAASTVPYRADIGQSVVDTLLQVASWESPTVPADMWSWLNRRPSLPPACSGRYWGSKRPVLKMVRALEDTETLTSYLLLVWSEWDFLEPRGFDEMCALIREDFSGQEMGHHRRVLLRRLGRVRGELQRGSGHLRKHRPRFGGEYLGLCQRQYATLEEILLEVDREALIRARCYSRFTCAIPLPYP